MAQSSTARAWAYGGTIFAATLMVVIGTFQILMGIAAIVRDQFFVQVGDNYLYNVDTTTWGWIHLGLGILVAVTGFALFTGTLWARAAGIFFAVLSAVANFFFIPYYPFWSLLVIALDIYVIWAIANAYRRAPMTESAMTEAASMTGGYMMQPEERWASTNVAAGRHYAGEPTKETGARTPMETPQESAESMRGRQGTMPQSGGYPPNPPNPPSR